MGDALTTCAGQSKAEKIHLWHDCEGILYLCDSIVHFHSYWNSWRASVWGDRYCFCDWVLV